MVQEACRSDEVRAAERLEGGEFGILNEILRRE